MVGRDADLESDILIILILFVANLLENHLNNIICYYCYK